MNSKNLRVILYTLAASSILLSTGSNANESAERDFSAVTCRDVLLASGDDRDDFVIALHAYLLGEAKQLTYDVDALSVATDRFLEACLKAPDASALSTMRDQAKK